MSDNITSNLEEQFNQTTEAAQAQQSMPQQQINLDGQTFFMIKLQEFDKMIAEAEAQVSNLKLQRATFVYDTNVQQLIAQKNQQAQAPVQPQEGA